MAQQVGVRVLAVTGGIGLPSSLRARLLLVVLIALLPVIAITLYSYHDRRGEGADNAREQALALARIAAAQHEQAIGGAKQLLIPTAQTLAITSAGQLRGVDPVTCGAFLAKVRAQSDIYANLGVADPDGRVVCSALPFAGELNVADRVDFQRALSMNTFAMGEFQIGRATGRATLNVGYPVPDGRGEPIGVVFAAIDLDRLTALAAQAQLPAGSTVTVTDRSGTVLAHYPEHEAWVGTAWQDASEVERQTNAGGGVAEVHGVDGQRRLYASAPLRAPNGETAALVSVGIPPGAAFGQANRTLALSLAALGVVALLSLLLARIGAELLLVRRLKGYVATTQRLARGQLSARTNQRYTADELGELGRAIDEMAGALQMRATELVQFNRDVEQRIAERTAELAAALGAAERAEAEARELWSSSVDLQCTSSQEGYFLRVNPACERVLGYSEGELLSRPIIDFVHPDDREAAVARMAQTRSGHPPPNAPARWLHKDGGYRWLEWIATPLEDGTIRGSARDITKRKEAEQQLLLLTTELQARQAQVEEARRESEEREARLRAVVETAVDGIITIDARGTVQSFNSAAERIFGYPADDVIGRNVSMLMPNPYRDEHDDYLGRYLATGERKVIGLGREVRGRRKDESTFPLELAVAEIALPDGSRIFSGLARDISERRELENRAQRLGRMADASQSEIYVFDAATLRFTQVNRGAAENLGYTTAEMRQMTPLDIKPALTAEAFDELLGPLRDGSEQLIQFETMHRRKDGTTYPVELRVQLSTQEASPAFFAVGADITARKRAEHELRARSEQLANANEELESFAYSVSHDLRAPLRAIMGFSEQLLSAYGEQFDERGRDRLSRVHAGAQRMNGLIDDILQLSRTSRSEMRFRPLDLSAAAQAVIDELRQGNPERLVEVVIEPGLRAEGDSGLIRTLLQNLLGNAWKFTSRSDAARIEFGATQEGGTTVFHVRDNGAGFDAEYADKLFAPFQRLHSPEEFEGTGIGLATVQRIVRRHGGRIWAEGAVGEGASFYFTLPTPGALARGLAA